MSYFRTLEQHRAWATSEWGLAWLQFTLHGPRGWRTWHLAARALYERLECARRAQEHD